MNDADLAFRVRLLEEKLSGIERELITQSRALAVLATGITIARWLGPFVVSVATVVIVLAKGG